jgi:hypothetical protein
VGSRTGQLAAVLLLLVAACTAPAPSAAPPISSPSPFPSPSPSPPPASPSPSAAASTAGVPLVPELLAVLPAELDGLPLTADPELSAEAAADPALASAIEGLAIGVLIDPAAGEFAVASVVELRPGLFDDAFYRGYRDSFDEAACSQAGGVARRAEAEIAGRATHIATCAGGVRTYHVALPDDRLIVSVSSLGQRRWGERLIAGLQP